MEHTNLQQPSEPDLPPGIVSTEIEKPKRKKTFLDLIQEMMIALSELDTCDDAVVQAKVDRIYQSLRNKEDGVYAFYNTLGKLIELGKEQRNQLSDRIRVLTNTQERIKAMIVMGYEATGILPKYTPFNKILVLNSSDKLEILDEDQIPKAYFEPVTSYKLNKVRLKKDLKKGLGVKGARLVPNKAVRGLNPRK